MYILTQSESLRNSKNIIFRIRSANLEEQYSSAKYKRRERIYKIKYQHKEYNIICPEFRKVDENSEPIVIIPEFLIPGRPYPVYVYLYAIDIYSSNPGMGQRKAAEATRKQFGLAGFAHTTLGRALKAFVYNIEGDKNTTEDNPVGTITGTDRGAEVKNTSVAGSVQKNDKGKKSGFPTTQSTESLRNKASKVLGGKAIQVCRQRAIELCNDLVRKWFKKYRRFLL